LHEGFAWRFKLPENCRFRASNNLLEFIVSIITPWIDLLSKRLRPGNCALSMTDSTTSAGWLKKTNFLEIGSDPIEETIRLKIARQHASHFTNHNIKEYSQWFPGKSNNIADSLSRDFDLDETEISKYLHLHYPSQLPPHLQVVPLPNEIESWLISLLLQLPMKEQLREPHTKTRPEPNGDGSSTLSQLVSNTTPTWTHSHDVNETSSSAPSPQQFGKDDFQASFRNPWLQEQSEIPFRVYARPSGSKDAKTHQKTMTFNLASFYNDSFDHTSTTIRNRNNKRPSPCASSPRSGNDAAVGQLTAIAIFFPMRSCEYLKVTQAEKRRTDILRIRNLRFFRDGKLIAHSNPHLEFSDCISITFEMQKKDEKNDTITQQASGAISMCPVQMAAAIVRRIRSYEGSDDNTPISAFWRFNRIDHVTSAQVIAAM
jgi:hypothetical protein